jgi:hypothetical protein
MAKDTSEKRLEIVQVISRIALIILCNFVLLVLICMLVPYFIGILFLSFSAAVIWLVFSMVLVGFLVPRLVGNDACPKNGKTRWVLPLLLVTTSLSTIVFSGVTSLKSGKIVDFYLRGLAFRVASIEEIESIRWRSELGKFAMSRPDHLQPEKLRLLDMFPFPDRIGYLVPIESGASIGWGGSGGPYYGVNVLSDAQSFHTGERYRQLRVTENVFVFLNFR